MKFSADDLKVAPELEQLERRGFHLFMNNFYLHFPIASVLEGGKMTKGFRSVYRGIVTDRMDLLHNQISHLTVFGEWAHTEKYAKQTPREFYEELDRTVVEIGSNFDEISTMMTRTCYHGQKDTEMCEELILKLYIAMRRKGYNHKDLTR